MTHASYHKHPIVSRRGHGHGHFHSSRSENLASTILSRGATDDLPADTDDGADSMINLLLIVLGLAFFALLLISGLYLMRRHRNRLQLADNSDVLPTYSESKGHRAGGLTIETTHNGRSSTIYIGRDGQPMLANPNSPPHSPDNVPEIHITFPDEKDDQGREHGGRVLVVRVGDNASVGLEPVQEEQLPAYEKESKDGFYSVDMDQIGGLKEKDHTFK